MKINPVAIQSYQHLSRRDNTAQDGIRADQAADKKTESVDIAPQQSVQSKMAVKGPSGDYTQYLSEDEQKAMELLFARFKDRNGSIDSTSGSVESGLGRMVDVKV
jgi:hypothetical protein